MLSWKSTSLLSLAAVATLAAPLPRTADACIFRWWRERCAARTAMYAPTTCCQPVCQPVCQPACPQQVCSYQPQTCYRTVTQQVPVTVYRPVTTVDPCTGCPSTTMQACTTMTTQVQRVPVTTYRQVCQLVQPTCNTCATPVVAQSVVQAQPMMMQQQQFAMPAAPATPGCASCGTSQSFAPAAPMSYPTAPQQFAPGPTTELAPQQPSSSLQPVPADQAPSLQSQSYYQGPSFPSTSAPTQYPATTNYPPVTSVPTTSGGLYPVPSATPSTGTSYQPRVPATAPAIRPLPDLDREEPAAPGLLNPQDRTAARELPAAGTIAPISWQTSAQVALAQPAAAAQPVAQPVKKWDDSGWRPAR
jgi:hypothetical protein